MKRRDNNQVVYEYFENDAKRNIVRKLIFRLHHHFFFFSKCIVEVFCVATRMNFNLLGKKTRIGMLGY